MRLLSKGIAFGSIIFASRGSFITFAFTRSRSARDLNTIHEKTTVSPRLSLIMRGNDTAIFVLRSSPTHSRNSRAPYSRQIRPQLEISESNGLLKLHCVQNTQGAEFASSFDTSRIAHVFHKGTERNIDSYSTFFDNAHRRHTGLAHYLEKRGIKDIYLVGLALDYCVKYSTLDARQLGLNTHVIVDGCRGIELEPGDIDRALDEMKHVGAVLLKSADL
jgi:nicotinamidase-related amidase